MKKLSALSVLIVISLLLNSYKNDLPRFFPQKTDPPKMAKAAGAHFTFGSNTHGLGAGDITWSLNMAKDCGLIGEDFFIPKRVLLNN